MGVGLGWGGEPIGKLQGALERGDMGVGVEWDGIVVGDGVTGVRGEGQAWVPCNCSCSHGVPALLTPWSHLPLQVCLSCANTNFQASGGRCVTLIKSGHGGGRGSMQRKEECSGPATSCKHVEGQGGCQAWQCIVGHVKRAAACITFLNPHTMPALPACLCRRLPPTPSQHARRPLNATHSHPNPNPHTNHTRTALVNPTHRGLPLAVARAVPQVRRTEGGGRAHGWAGWRGAGRAGAAAPRRRRRAGPGRRVAGRRLDLRALQVCVCVCVC